MHEKEEREPYRAAPIGTKTYTHMPFGKYRGWLLKNVPDDYYAWLLTQKLSRAVRATVEGEVARREQVPIPALSPPPVNHPDLEVVAIAVERFGTHYHWLKHPTGIDSVETEPCTRCDPPLVDLDALLYGEPESPEGWVLNRRLSSRSTGRTATATTGQGIASGLPPQSKAGTVGPVSHRSR